MSRRSCASGSSWRSSAASTLEQLMLDPGPDFGKTPAQTVEVLRELGRLHALGGRCCWRSRGRTSSARSPAGRRARGWPGTLAAVGYGVDAGAHMLRVHDVAAVGRVPGRARRARAARARSTRSCGWPTSCAGSRVPSGRAGATLLDSPCRIAGRCPNAAGANRFPQGGTMMPILDRAVAGAEPARRPARDRVGAVDRRLPAAAQAAADRRDPRAPGRRADWTVGGGARRRSSRDRRRSVGDRGGAEPAPARRRGRRRRPVGVRAARRGPGARRRRSPSARSEADDERERPRDEPVEGVVELLPERLGVRAGRIRRTHPTTTCTSPRPRCDAASW